MKLLLFPLLLLFCLKLNAQKPIPPGKMIAQINMYKLDNYFYDITYFDKEEFHETEEVHYEIFKRFVISNDPAMVRIWMDLIYTERDNGDLMLPDSTNMKILNYYFKVHDASKQEKR